MKRHLHANLRDYNDDTDRLEALYRSVGALDFSHQKLVAELIMLRLFSLLESHFESVALKILCNTQYLDGTLPNLFHVSANGRNALSNILNFGRKKALKKVQLKWTNYISIESNVRHLINASDNYLNVLKLNSAFIDEMRFVRNHIAHNNSDTRQKFKPVVIKYYGAYINTVTPGLLLLSPRRKPPLIIEYIKSSLIIIRDLVKK
jgi:hypothetical protein